MFHAIPPDRVLQQLGTSLRGLQQEQAQSRLQQYGRNELQKKKGDSPIVLFLHQFASPIVWILIAAVIISVLEHELVDAAVIAVLLLINAVIGFFQEYKAEKSIEALQKLASVKATVLRSGKEQIIDAKELVPGDIILLETGQKVPADVRLLEIVQLEVQEAALTGESSPVTKRLTILPEQTPLADQKNMTFAGTVITNGRGKGVVCSTGMQMEIGKIAHLIQETEEEPTPLQKKLKKLGMQLGIGTIIICFIIFFAGVFKGEDPAKFLIVAVALAVAAIPEGLPAIVTLCLAIGVRRLAGKNALLRRLSSAETLGCTTVICTDKTGTLTHNEMTVRKLWVDGNVISVTGSGYSTSGSFSDDSPTLSTLLQIGALNNNASLTSDGLVGDPTEGALLVSALKNRLDYQILGLKHKRIGEIPFTSERKRMTTIHDIEGKRVAYTKGAVDVLLQRCASVEIEGKQKPLTRELAGSILQQQEQFAGEALRVLGFAYRPLKKEEPADAGEAVERNLIFVGMQAMIDPPREGVKESIATCHAAGIRVIMITGDHQRTAEAIAKEIGIEGSSITGSEIEHADLDREVEHIAIYARVDPKHKLRIVDALQKGGHIVAMTGDGVNDAPALKKADVGIAMGISGTDVAKEAADIILTDDNFTSIVNAVEEGRAIYDNIQKFVLYLLSSNIGEVLTLFIAMMIGLPLPITALMILWMNLVTDGLPALALGVDPPDPDIMLRHPRNPKSNIVSLHRSVYMAAIGILLAGGTLSVFVWSLVQNGWQWGMHWTGGHGYMVATTMAFTTLVMFQMVNVINCRSETASIFKAGLLSGLLSNKKLLLAMLASVAFQVLAVYGPLQPIFETTTLSIPEWIGILIISSTVLWFGEAVKFVRRQKAPHGSSAEFLAGA
ncbi:calcium-translocating P-type ATPase, SERCA-type [Candidatus Woesearchaeota archaeon]|nr:calcium-translocating P-type ATPase, SERCA-type [Candidatus Woesearchaeota archaeon]